MNSTRIRAVTALVLLALAGLVIAGGQMRSVAATGGLVGDVNKDGTTNAIDGALVLQYSAGLLSSINPNADANGDGAVNSIDAAIILQMNAGLIERPTPPSNPDLEITAVMGTDPTGVGNVLTFVITATNRGAPVCNLRVYMQYTVRQTDGTIFHGSSKTGNVTTSAGAYRLDTGESGTAWVLGNGKSDPVLLSQKIIAADWEFC